MVNWLKSVLSHEWEFTPAGGLTGDAYFATKGDSRLFLKRNSSPFLAVLSAEGIVPKLVWTKRMENGDVITAQEWLEGRELKPEEMQHAAVANLLRKIHQSTELLHMLMRLGKKPSSPTEQLTNLTNQISRLALSRWPEVKQAFEYLIQFLPDEKRTNQVVCHSDLNHNNLLLSKTGQLYLIDWENAMIADPIIDYGMVLNNYIPKKDWPNWLSDYGVIQNEALLMRMYWYLLMDSFRFLIWHFNRCETTKVNERLANIARLNRQIVERA